MNVKIRDILTAKDSLQKLASMDLPVKVSYRLSKGVSKFNSELKIFVDKRNEIIDRLGTPKEDGRGKEVKEDSENWKEFLDKLEELLDIEVESEIEPVKISIIEASGGKLSATDFLNLTPFIEDTP